MHQPYPEIRFKDLEQAELYMSTLDIKNSVPTHILEGTKLVPNPEYIFAPYAIKYIFHAPTKEIILR